MFLPVFVGSPLTRCLQTLNQAYANILEKHVDKQDVANWNVELDWNDGPYVKFTHNITNATCKSVPELVSHTQGQKRKAQKNTKYLNDIRNTIPKQNSKAS